MTQEPIDNELLGEAVSEEISIKPTYPSVSDRVKAVIMDNAIMVGFMIIAAIVFSFFENASGEYRMYTVLFIFVIYDPLFTSLFGGTVGHMLNGIRVKKEKDETKNIIFPLAFVRYVFKTLLGWISLLTVVSSKNRRAIHDMIVKSVVVYKRK